MPLKIFLAGLFLQSPAFSYGGEIPKVYTCDGKDISPPLIWKDIPKGTRSLALIMEDPDAPGGTWVHWVLYRIPVRRKSLPPGIPPYPKVKSMYQGKNSWGKIGYGGPCPHSGKHRYFFYLYALKKKLFLPPSLTKEELLKEISPYILKKASYMGVYQRKK